MENRHTHKLVQNRRISPRLNLLIYQHEPSIYTLMESPADSLDHYYFHPQILGEQFPNSSTSYSSTPTMLLRDDNFSLSAVESVLKKSEQEEKMNWGFTK
jgi:hypothetical protein